MTAVSLRLPPPPPSPPPRLFSFSSVLLLGVLVCMVELALFHLGPVPPRHETTRRFDNPLVPLASLCSHRGSYHRFYPEQQRGCFCRSLFGSKHLDVMYHTSGPCLSWPTRSPVLSADPVTGSPRRPGHGFTYRPSPLTSPARLVAQVLPALRPPQK